MLISRVPSSKLQHHPLLTRSLSFSVHKLVAWVILIAFVLVLVSKTFSLALSDLGVSGANYLDEGIFFGFLSFVIAIIVLSKRLYISPLYPWVLVFSLFGGLASLYNRVAGDIFVLGFLLTIKPMLVFITYQSIPLNWSTAIRLLTYIDRLLATITIIALMYALIFEIILAFNPLPGALPVDHRLGFSPKRSFFIYPSQFSSLMTVISFYHFTRTLLGRSKLQMFLLCLSILGVGISLRMKGLFFLPVNLVIIYFFVYLRSWKIKKMKLVKLGLIAVVAAGVIVVFAISFQNLIVQRYQNTAVAGRFVMLEKAWLINQDTFGLGAGFGMFGSAVSINYNYSDLYYRYGIANLQGGSQNKANLITDQWWAWFLGEVGIPGVILFLVALFLIIYGLRRIGLQRQNEMPLLAALAYMSMGSIIYGFMSGLAAASLTAPPTGYYIMSLAGLTYAIHRSVSRQALISNTVNTNKVLYF